MLSHRRRMHIIELAAIGLPVAMVFMGRAALSTPPPIAATVPVSTPEITAPPVVTTKPLAPEQVKAVEWIRQLPESLQLASPLNHPIEVVIATPVIDPEPDVAPPPPPPVISPIAGLKLTGVLGNEEGQLAAINGKIYRIGEDVKRGLKLTGIDPRSSVVTLTDSRGQTYQLKREQPDLRNDARP